MVQMEESSKSSISLVFLPWLMRSATWVSFGVRLAYLAESRREKGEMISLRLSSRIVGSV